MKLKKPGMRTIKSGLGVMVCVLSSYIGLINNTFFASMGCVVAMQTTLRGSWKAGFNRVRGTFVGGIVGFLLSLISPENAVLACLGIITAIYLCNLLDMNDSVVITCVVFCITYLNKATGHPVSYSLFRMLDTLVGVIIGIMVNYFIYRPNYVSIANEEVKSVREIAIEILKKHMGKKKHTEEDNENSKELLILKEKITKLEFLYEHILIESNYTKKDINIDKIQADIDSCNNIYLHLRILENMEDRQYLDECNCIDLEDIYMRLNDNSDIINHHNTVYNYHIKSVLDCINRIDTIEEDEIYNEKEVVGF